MIIFLQWFSDQAAVVLKWCTVGGKKTLESFGNSNCHCVTLNCQQAIKHVVWVQHLLNIIGQQV